MSNKQGQTQNDKPVSLLCEYAVNPMGIDTSMPRFSWKTNSGERGGYQTAYRVVVAGSLRMLDRSVYEMWDSGRITASRSLNIEYSGKPLLSRRTYYWKVSIWDEDGRETGFSSAASFEMGLLDKLDWKAEWVGYPGGRCGELFLFRKKFDIEKTVARAR